MRKHIFILSISSDIGYSVANYYLNRGWLVTGTYRNENRNIQELKRVRDVNIFHCDLGVDESIELLALQFSALKPWDLFVSAVGEPLPLTPFFETEWDAWSSSFYINCLGQLRILRNLWRFRNFTEDIPTVLFFAAGGTNGPVSNFSAYTSAKIHLIKMVELLAFEDDRTRYCIAGPGWTHSKTHEYMLKNLSHDDPRVSTIQKFISHPDAGTSHQDICLFIDWILTQDVGAVSGRNFSIVSDDWRGDRQGHLIKALTSDANMFKLRRYKNDLP